MCSHVDRHPHQVLGAQRASLMRDPQPLAQQQLQLWRRADRANGLNLSARVGSPSSRRLDLSLFFCCSPL